MRFCWVKVRVMKSSNPPYLNQRVKSAETLNRGCLKQRANKAATG